MFDRSVTISEIFAVELSMTLTLTFTNAKVKSKYKCANRKPLCDVIFDDNSNVGSICYNFRDICISNLDIDLQSESRSNLNMLMERPNATAYLMTLAMLALPFTVSLIFSRNVHDLDLDLQNEPRSNPNMPIERSHAIFYVVNINVYQICPHLQDNHVWTSQCTRCEYLTLKMKVKNVDDLNDNLFVNAHTRAQIGASRSSCLLAVL